jgi:hypothetical protein
MPHRVNNGLTKDRPAKRTPSCSDGELTDMTFCNWCVYRVIPYLSELYPITGCKLRFIIFRDVRKKRDAWMQFADRGFGLKTNGRQKTGPSMMSLSCHGV